MANPYPFVGYSQKTCILVSGSSRSTVTSSSWSMSSSMSWGLSWVRSTGTPTLSSSPLIRVSACGGDQAREPDAGPQELERDPDVDPARRFRGVVHQQHAQVLAPGFLPGDGSWCWFELLSFEGVDQPLGLVRGDLSLRQHLQDLAALLVH